MWKEKMDGNVDAARNAMIGRERPHLWIFAYATVWEPGSEPLGSSSNFEGFHKSLSAPGASRQRAWARVRAKRSRHTPWKGWASTRALTPNGLAPCTPPHLGRQVSRSVPARSASS